MIKFCVYIRFLSLSLSRETKTEITKLQFKVMFFLRAAFCYISISVGIGIADFCLTSTVYIQFCIYFKGNFAVFSSNSMVHHLQILNSKCSHALLTFIEIYTSVFPLHYKSIRCISYV